MVALAALLSAFSLLLGGATPARVDQAASAQPVVALSVSGRGWGHGVGMSQWGAYGFAQHGSTHAEILAHYYRGTELGKVTSTPERILLLRGASELEVSSRAPFAVKDGTGESYDLAAGAYSFGNGLRLKVDPREPAKQLTGPLVFSAGAEPLALNDRRYRGSFEIAVENGRLRAINVVGVEGYVAGVVPSEVPYTWPAEALKAQAVAARSYALATRKPGSPFDAFPDVRSQVYGGLDAERPQTTLAVQSTAGQAVLYQGKVATTYFFSTSGGRTASIEDAWPGSKPVPYLVSVPDPYDGASPHHAWGPIRIGQAKLRQALSLHGTPIDARVDANPSLRADNLVVTLASGAEVKVPGTTVRAALGLQSSWFRFGVLALNRPAAAPVTFGTKTPLAGVVRGVSRVSLERRPLGGAWQKLAPVAASNGGAFAVPVKGQMTADYRLTADKLAGGPVRLVVAPRLKLALGDAPGVLTGRVRPAFPGATVAVQRSDGGRWVRAGKAALDGGGTFRVELVEPAGTFRARLAARDGYAAAVSRPLVVAP